MNDRGTREKLIALSKPDGLKKRAKDWLFAYGSNMSLAQIRSRCSRPEVIGPARLADHRLAFCGRSAVWDGAMETVEPMPGHEVWGVMFDLTRMDWERLDLWQDARMDGGGVYFHFPVTVADMEGTPHSVRMYKKDIQGQPREPSREYLEHIARGARENGLPPAYIEALLNRNSKPASYAVPMRAGHDLGETAGMSCGDCAAGAA